MAVDPFSDVKAFLGGGRVPAKFPKVGAIVEGTVTGWRLSQRTDMKTGEPLFWEGKQAVREGALQFPESSKKSPAMQLLLDIQGEPTGVTWKTNQYIEEPLPDDDGSRTWYVHGNAQKALAQGLKDAGDADIEVGAYVKAERTKSVKAGDFFAYTYKVVWTPASKNEKAAKDFMGSPEDDGADPFAD